MRNNPFESPKSEVTEVRAPTLPLWARIVRAVSLGLLGYTIYAGGVYFSGRYFGSFENLPRDIWARGIYAVLTFAGTELFVNSRNRSVVRRFAYSMVTFYFSAILGGMLLQVIPESSQFPYKSQVADDQIRIVLMQATLFGCIFLVCATTLNFWRSRQSAAQPASHHEQREEQ
ncbi:hypothetical protein [Bremerella alba]|uniref:Uncharacterized protein n=1 Tax=Bremerella alba TaxID=980252 RepID=A0A7V8V7A6_9BACT|nr:hypothetical protein [Bremerella alba]MBA2116294.1 hypothetical protein [Bremerella alba]